MTDTHGMKPQPAGRPGLIRRAAGRVRHPRRIQLHTRVLAGVVGITLIALAAFDFAAVTALHGYLVSRTDSQLQTVLGMYRPAQQSIQGQRAPVPVGTKTSSGTVSWKATGPPSGSTATPSGVRWVVTGPRAQLPGGLAQFYVGFTPANKQITTTFVGGNPGLVPRVPVRLQVLAGGGRPQTVISMNGSAPLRLRALHVGGGTLIASTSLGSVSRTVNRLALIVIIGSLAAAALVGLGVAWVLRRGLRPIETMAAEADRITVGDLTERVHPQDPRTEVGRLGSALNGMLTRIEASVCERDANQELTRQFFADASHELRTPLASLRANAELYQQGALPERAQVDEAMRRIALEAQRMSHLVDDMLRLARLDQQPSPETDPLDLSAVVAGCAERAQIADPARSWDTEIEEDLTVTGDAEMLRRAIDNLLANVRTHTPGDTAATITAARQNGSVVVEVSDDGPGVAATHMPRIFDRFYRAPAPARRPGCGLGLAIVSAIAATHNGTVHAEPNEPHGLRVTLSLPAALCPDETADAAPDGEDVPAPVAG